MEQSHEMLGQFQDDKKVYGVPLQKNHTKTRHNWQAIQVSRFLVHECMAILYAAIQSTLKTQELHDKERTDG
jgi:hypothetical protein